MADGERSPVVFVYASSAILCYAVARARAAYTHQAAMAFRAKTPSESSTSLREGPPSLSGRSVERARSAATVGLESTIAPSGSVAGPNRVPLGDGSTASFWRASARCQLNHVQANVDAEQDGRGEDGPSALDAELYVARPSGRCAMGACSSEGGRVEDNHTAAGSVQRTCYV